MNFGVKKTIEANGVSNELAGEIYPNAKVHKDKIDNNFVTLEKLCNVFANRTALHKETTGKKFTCYIEKKAFDAFIRFANETYQSRHHEATGLIVGYYLHNKDNPDSKFIVGTNFLPATGNTTNATCEFSYQDSIEHSNYYNAHKLLPLIWIHSHPGFGAFYSGTDDFTLKSYFYSNHQTGVVVDNLKKEGLGYKMYGDRRQEEDVFIFDLDKSNSTHLVYSQLNKKKKTEDTPVFVDIDTSKNDDNSKKKEDQIEKETEEKTEDIKVLKTKVENLENEIVILKRVTQIRRPDSNVISWILVILFALFLVEGVALVANFKHTNDLEKHIVELQEKIVQQLDSIKNSIAATPTIIDKVNTTTPETIIEDTNPQTTDIQSAKTENSDNVQQKDTTTQKKAKTESEKKDSL